MARYDSKRCARVTLRYPESRTYGIEYFTGDQYALFTDEQKGLVDIIAHGRDDALKAKRNWERYGAPVVNRGDWTGQERNNAE